MTTPTPAALCAAHALYRSGVDFGPMLAADAAEIIDREGLREATEALRRVMQECGEEGFYSGKKLLSDSGFEMVRAALARLESKP